MPVRSPGKQSASGGKPVSKSNITMPSTFKRYFRYTSWPIIIAMIALTVIGIFAIRACELAEGRGTSFSVRQIQWAGVALAAFVIVTIVPYQRIGRLAYPLFGVTMALLLLLAAARYYGYSTSFLPAKRGAHRWISLGIVQVQPSEIAKISFIILLAWYLRYRDNYRRLLGLSVPFIVTLAPMGLILYQPDLGTSLLLLPTLYFMLFMAGAKWKHLLGIVAVATVLIFLPVPRKLTPRMTPAEIADRKALAYWTVATGESESVFLAAPLAVMEWHQLKRIDGWLRQGDPGVSKERGYQLVQSKTTLAAGMLTGRGDWADADTYLASLPDDHTDFVFSVVGGQWGFAGCAGVLLLYGVIFLFGVEIAVITYDPFGRLLAVGVLALLLAQIFINVGVTMGLMPITGMTLPLVSYGGSSLVVNCASLGLLVNVGLRRPILLAKHPFEHGPKRERPLAVRKMS